MMPLHYYSANIFTASDDVCRLQSLRKDPGSPPHSLCRPVMSSELSLTRRPHLLQETLT